MGCPGALLKPKEPSFLSQCTSYAKARIPKSCRLNTEVGPPDYLKENPIINITPAADEDTVKAFQSVDVINEWPESPSTALDATQWAAMKNIVTNKVAIIQGPPGTGKTHVSKIAIEIMIRNRKPDDPPIIVACQTNHALDQLLSFIQVFEPNFIRLGGRSTDPHIKSRALHAVRKGQVYDDIPGSVYGKARRDIMTQTLKLKSALDPIKAMSEPGPLDAKKLSDLKVISPEQLQSLEKGAEAWVVSDATEEYTTGRTPCPPRPFLLSSTTSLDYALCIMLYVS